MGKIDLRVIAILGIAVLVLLFMSGSLKSVVSSPEKDYNLNKQCNTYDSCLTLLKQQYTAEQSIKIFNCDFAGCYMIITKEVVSK